MLSIPENILGHIAEHNEDGTDGVELFVAFIGLTAQKQNESIQSPKQATKNPQSEQKYWINTQSPTHFLDPLIRKKIQPYPIPNRFFSKNPMIRNPIHPPPYECTS